MAAKKVYAVRRGKVIGILDSWDACKKAVDGYPGAEYKSFKTLEEARAYMEGIAYREEPFGQEETQTDEAVSLQTGMSEEKRIAGGDGVADGNKTKRSRARLLKSLTISR